MAIMIVVCRNVSKRFDKPLFSGFGKIKLFNLILHNTHCNEYGQISLEICRKIEDFMSKQKCFD